MKVTALSVQQKNTNRVNVMVDGVYRFSLDIIQVTEQGIKVGKEFTEAELDTLEQESEYGKLYARALEYCLMRPHSTRELRDYLYKKTRTTRFKSRQTGEIKERAGVAEELTNRVYTQLCKKGYVDDEQFTRYWIENRNQRKGTSQRKLRAELRTKGIETTTIDQFLQQSDRTDEAEIQKVIAKKQSRYTDPEKLMRYLASQGFSYDDIKQALRVESDD